MFLHRGIAMRQFQRSFVIAEGIEIVGASLDSGLLNIDLRRELRRPWSVRSRSPRAIRESRRGNKSRRSSISLRTSSPLALADGCRACVNPMARVQGAVAKTRRPPLCVRSHELPGRALSAHGRRHGERHSYLLQLHSRPQDFAEKSQITGTGGLGAPDERDLTSRPAIGERHDGDVRFATGLDIDRQLRNQGQTQAAADHLYQRAQAGRLQVLVRLPRQQTARGQRVVAQAVAVFQQHDRFARQLAGADTGAAGEGVAFRAGDSSASSPSTIVASSPVA